MSSATSKERHAVCAEETTAPSKQAHRRKVSWLPAQHGTWMMMAVPFILGGIGGTWAWQHAILAMLWLCGYCCFFAFSAWAAQLRKVRGRKNRVRNQASTPFFVWFTATVLAGLATLICAPQLLPWLIVFAPVAVVSLVQTCAHRIRSLLTRSCEVVAAGLMCAVAWHMGALSAHSFLGWEKPFNPLLAFFSREQVTGAGGVAWEWISSWAATIPLGAIYATIAVTAYFWSTIPFVKSLMRERNSRPYHFLVIFSHAGFLVVACALAVCGYASFPLVIFWLIVAIRAWIFTELSRAIFAGKDRNIHLSPKQLLMFVGITETILSIVYIPVVLASV